MFWKILLGMCILLFVIIKYKFQKSPSITCNRGSKVAVLQPTLHWSWGWTLYLAVFSPTSSTYQKHLKHGQCLEIGDRRSLSKFGDVIWPTSNFADRSVFNRPVCKIVNLEDMDQKVLRASLLTLILIFVQNLPSWGSDFRKTKHILSTFLSPIIVYKLWKFICCLNFCPKLVTFATEKVQISEFLHFDTLHQLPPLKRGSSHEIFPFKCS